MKPQTAASQAATALTPRCSDTVGTIAVRLKLNKTPVCFWAVCDIVEVLFLCPLPKPAYKGIWGGGGAFKALNQCNNIQSLFRWWENGWAWHFSIEGLWLRCSESFWFYSYEVDHSAERVLVSLSYWTTGYKNATSARHVLLTRGFFWLFSLLQPATLMITQSLVNRV